MALSFPKLSKSAWPGLVAPMLLASLGLHGLLLFLPLGQEQEGAIASADLAEDSIAITRVTPSTSSSMPGLKGIASAVTPGTPSAVMTASVSRAAPPSRGQQPGVKGTASPVLQAPAQPPRPRVVATSPATTTQGAFSPAVEPSPTPPLPTSRPLIDPSLGERLMAYATGLALPAEQMSRLSRYLQDRFFYNEAATQLDTYDRNLQSWQATIQQVTGLPELTPEIDRTHFSLTVPQRVCLRQAPEDVRLGVLTKTDGTLAEPPVVLRSSGYSVLDQRAQMLVASHSFPPADSIQAHTLKVSIQVDYGLSPCLGGPIRP